MQTLLERLRRASVPRDAAPRRADIEPLWFEWLTLGGLLVFATWLLEIGRAHV